MLGFSLNITTPMTDCAKACLTFFTDCVMHIQKARQTNADGLNKQVSPKSGCVLKTDFVCSFINHGRNKVFKGGIDNNWKKTNKNNTSTELIER